MFNDNDNGDAKKRVVQTALGADSQTSREVVKTIANNLGEFNMALALALKKLQADAPVDKDGNVMRDEDGKVMTRAQKVAADIRSLEVNLQKKTKDDLEKIWSSPDGRQDYDSIYEEAKRKGANMVVPANQSLLGVGEELQGRMQKTKSQRGGIMGVIAKALGGGQKPKQSPSATPGAKDLFKTDKDSEFESSNPMFGREETSTDASPQSTSPGEKRNLKS
jgi:hypothetical protein